MSLPGHIPRAQGRHQRQPDVEGQQWAGQMQIERLPCILGHTLATIMR